MQRHFAALALAALAAVTSALPAPASAGNKEAARTRKQIESRSLESGLLYAGAAPGVDFGGNSLPRALYMDVLRAGWILPQGIDLGFALSGMNFAPDAGDYAIGMGRFSVGYRPFLKDPLPIVQPYVLAGAGVGGEGRYLCEPEPSCDPATDVCRDVCGRNNWAMSFFGGGGIDVNAHLLDLGDQQLVAYAGVEGRYEYIPSRYHMGVLVFPVGIKLQ